MSATPNAADLATAAEAAYKGLPIRLEGSGTDTTRDFTYTEGPVIVSGTIRIEGYAVCLTRIEAKAATPDGEITAATVKALPTGRIVGNLTTLLAIERARLEAEGKPHTPLFTREQATGATSSRRRPTQRGGRPLVNDRMLKELAEMYLEESAAGGRGLNARLAARLGWPQNTVTTRLARARRDGWLASTVKGRAGGEPGPRLLMARLAEESGMVPVEGETDEEREARSLRAHEFSEKAGELWEQVRGKRAPDAD